MAKSPVVILYDSNGVAMAVANGVAVPVGTQALIVAGSDGTNTRFVRTASDGTVRVDPSGTTTQPVSAASLPLPTGAATSAAQTDGTQKTQVTTLPSLPTGSNTIGKVDQGTGGASAWKVDGSAVTQPVSAASLPLPTGAATSANQTTLGSQTTKLNDGTNTAAVTAANALKVDGSAVTQPVSAASLPLPTGAATEVTLAAIKNTDGVKKITDALPTGDNRIGRVKVTDDTNVLGIDSQNHAYVSGKSAVGATPASNPVLVSGVDGGGLKRVPLTDTAGRLQQNVAQWIGSIAPTVGQKLMAASLPVTLASDQVLPVSSGTLLESGSYPDPNVEVVGTDTIYSDAYGNIRTRGPILTDEGSFRDDFSGSSLLTSVTGTLTLTNGLTTVTGVGTLFTSELQTINYIRLSADPNSAFQLIDTVVDDTTLELAAPYTGTGGSGAAVSSFWEMTIPASPANLTVGSSLVNLIARTTSGDIIAIERDADYLPCAMVSNCAISQRIANQSSGVGFADMLVGASQLALFVFDGTDNTKVRCRTAFAADSVQDTLVSLPGGALSSAQQTYEIVLAQDRCTFVINGTVTAVHRIHLPGPYTPLEQVAYVSNTAAVGSATTLSLDTAFFSNRDNLQLEEPVAIEGSSGGQPITIQFGNPGGGTALPKLINVNFNKTEGAILANVYKRVATYTVPSSFNGYLIKFVSFQGEAASSRVVAETNLGSHNDNTNVWTAGISYASPQWAAVVQAEVTTAYAAGSGNVVLTVTYTNELGVGSRTGTITIPKGSAIGARFDLVLQAGDLGLQSIQAVSGTPAQVGVSKILGLIQLALHQDQSTTTQTETLYAPGAITFPTGTTLGIEYAGGTVSKSRLLDALIQLVQ